MRSAGKKSWSLPCLSLQHFQNRVPQKVAHQTREFGDFGATGKGSYIANAGSQTTPSLCNSIRDADRKTLGKLIRLCKEDRLDEALDGAELLIRLGIPVPRETIYHILQGCLKRKELEAGRRVHSLITRSKLDSITVLGDHLIRLFTACGSLEDANKAFSKIWRPTNFTWSAIISANTKLGRGNEALKLYGKMQQAGTQPDKVVFSCILKACSSSQLIDQGRLIHEEVVRNGCDTDVVIGNTLIDMYTNCEVLEEARKVFDSLPGRDLWSWGAMIHGYSSNDNLLSAFDLFKQMEQEGIKPNGSIYISLINGCAKVRALHIGKITHDFICRSELNLHASIANSLVEMYAKCGSQEEACKMFDQLPNREADLCTGGYSHAQDSLAFESFQNMDHEGIKWSKTTYLEILKACTNSGSTIHGRMIHDEIVKNGLSSDVVVECMLVTMYANFGSLDEAQRVFDHANHKSSVLWSALVAGYIQHENYLFAFHVFSRMQSENVLPSRSIFLSLLKACSRERLLEQGRLLHDQIVNYGLESDGAVKTALLDMYAKGGYLQEAHGLFLESSYPDVVSWSALIAGYAQDGCDFMAFELYKEMLEECIQPNEVTLLCLLKACCNIEALEQGRLVHMQAIEYAFISVVAIQSALVNMNEKCGCLDDAQAVFKNLKQKDVVSFGSMISAYAQHGQVVSALNLFHEMQLEGLKPDEAIYSSILKGCAIVGALQVGRVVHDKIVKNGLESNIIIASTLVETYAKCGNMEEAQKVFSCLPNRDVASWGVMIAGYGLLGKCCQAGQCLANIQEDGLRPSDVAYTNMLAACSYAGLLEVGRQVFGFLREESVGSTMEHYSCIVNNLGSVGCLSEARDVLLTMPMLPDNVVWTSLLTSCRNYGNSQMERECCLELLKLDPDAVSDILEKPMGTLLLEPKYSLKTVETVGY